ncbi:ABC transporter ATP-binding protein [Synechococcus sp. Tobar12-5m-g]|uniref:ABC transporter ATP-binding protein n=1 Tax=unclassified Synechococcus TaxID=2626047 RepID=UPI0020CD8DD7|nr:MULTISPECIES: ABC transporter ATP-binding protein [unclassified Synechococcus]MCP9771252.1 ABC transporter ATP-binding protein [Synechococcus sp. Tobar12-5m-g]MCP9872192.1 ABC transporter ATP-binding protein [Synechococcus sp. Cruz CV-v-12]
MGPRPLESVIELERLQKQYGPVTAVAGVDLRIGRGEMFGLLGPSGCGKTTTLRLIAGFDSPSSGAIRLEGVDVSRVPPHRRNVNTVFQNYALFPHLSVWENVAFGPRAQKIEATTLRQRVGEALAIVGLTDLAHRRPAQLSGGQQQRVALARALVNAPAALLLDEPLAALDPNLRRAMQGELRRIQQEVGISFILVTHDQDEALALCDRIAVMRVGRVEQIGTPRQLYDQPCNSFVAGFVGEVNLLPLPGGQERLMVRPERVRLQADPPAAGQAGRTAWIESVMFQGPLQRVALVGADGTPLLALVAADSPGKTIHPPLTSGQRCWAVWDLSAERPLPGGSPDQAPTASRSMPAHAP